MEALVILLLIALAGWAAYTGHSTDTRDSDYSWHPGGGRPVDW